MYKALCVPAFRPALLIVAALALTPVYSPAQARLKSIYAFQASTDGAAPTTAVIRDAAGNIFGTVQQGGAELCHIGGCGIVYRIDANGSEKVLHRFTGGTDGAFPYGTLRRDTAGNLYGTAYEGGLGYGVIFKLASNGTFAAVYSFTGGSDGANPISSLVIDTTGSLYGTTYYGGAAIGSAGYGTIFRLDPSGSLTVLYTFAGGADGSNPTGTLTLDDQGNIYGTTRSGGDTACESPYGCGTVYKLDPIGVHTVLYSFTGKPDGATPRGDLVRDAAGNLYGNTQSGGTGAFFGYGTTFKLDPSNNETILHTFSGAVDGAYPGTALVRDSSGNLFSSAQMGGNGFESAGHGLIFKLDRTGRETVLYTFKGGRDGSQPVGGVVTDKAGNLYGTTYEGGVGNGYGTVFELLQ